MMGEWTETIGPWAPVGRWGTVAGDIFGSWPAVLGRG